MAESGSRTEVKFLRKELATQLEECTRAHNLYRQSNDLDHVPSEDWIIQLENVTATYYGRIDEYIRTVNRPPSAVPSNPSDRSRQSIRSNTTWLDPNHPRAFQQPENPFDDQGSASISEIRDLPSEMEYENDLRQRLDDERLAREDLERRLQQLQTDMAAKEKAGPEKEDNAATAALTEELQNLRLQMNQWKQTQDAEMANRIKLEKSLRGDIEKQKRELEEEKLARQTEKYRYEREKESDWDKFRSAVDERFAQHNEATSTNKAAHNTESHRQHQGARPKKPPASAGNRGSGPPPYTEDDASIGAESVQSYQAPHQDKDMDANNWSFNLNGKEDRQPPGIHGSAHSVFRLPKMDLKPFDGDPKNWQDFIAIFRDLVHNNSSLTTTQKMAILKRCLTSEIRDGLGDSLSSPALYQEALQELESTYGHPQIVSRTYIQSLIQLQRVSANDYKALLKFSQAVNGVVASLRSGGYQHELKSSGLLDIIVTKLPSEVQSRWGRQIVKNHPVSQTLQDFATWFSKFVKGEMMAKHSQISLTPITPAKPKSGSKPGRQPDNKSGFSPTINAVTHPATSGGSSSSKSKTAQQAEAPPKKLICLLCKGDHRLGQCKTFVEMSLEERIKIIKENGCCLRCLSKGHMSKDCTSRKKCIINNCGQPHHSLLHDAPRLAPTEPKSILKPEKTVTLPLNVATVSVDDDESCTVMQIVPVTLEADGKTLETFGFLDPGSQTTLILDRASEQLDLDGDEEMTKLGTFHGDDPIIKMKKVKFNIQPRDGSRSFPVKKAFSVPKLNINAQQIEWPVTKREWGYLQDVDLPHIDTNNVTILIGRDVMRVHDVLEHRSPPDGTEAPDGILTHFGWSIAGPVPESLLKRQTYRPISVMHISRQQSDEFLNEAVQRFWRTESYGVGLSSHQNLPPDDQKALRILQDTIRHTGERYESPSVISRHWSAALKRIRRLLGYAAVVNEYIAAGHAKLVDPNSPFTRGHVWYLPHHGVTAASKPGKVRVVFNPSARFRGTSLNEELYKGPDLLTSLIGVLLRFRLHPCAISGDIQKMYHQVQVPEHQQSLLRFIWREPGSTEDPQTFQMTVHVFGAVSSPTSCIYALRRTAEDFGPQYPGAAEKVLKNIYVDNYLDSANTEAEAIAQRQEVTDLLKHGGFNMVQWMSSSRPVLTSVNQADRARALDITTDPLPVERTLGILWDCQHDAFMFNSNTRLDVKTKRQVLQEIASIFDPLGFLVPIVMVAKILMQDIWRSGVEWDDQLPQALLDVWKRWVADLPAISTLKIPRCFRRSTLPSEYQLHVFTDASELGFAACVFLRASYSESHVGLTLIMAKSRVAPLRQLSIPRLELQGAVLGAQLCATVIKDLGPIASAVYYWCDSQTVLQWIHSKTCKYHAFVAHRVTDILDKSEATQWRHIPGEHNPADDGSRGVSAAFFTTQHRWFRGPDFLLMPEMA
ncbi:uncharacterized protein LOC124311889 [Daphnia pulicaria]|uniref:uncharacterized protein LOC124311889 n=1 Tax=Daphnia pulicaria TaxID=35523 RepID=UPI001EEB72E4|nr:uncharacterized protein LOC124311889 [Daphnia pulicaria]